MSDGEFAGKTVLVTGGTRGIGRAAAVRLASEGARVALNYVANESKAAEAVEELRSLGATVVAVQGDVSVLGTQLTGVGFVQGVSHCVASGTARRVGSTSADCRLAAAA